ncbi:hypothetical protein B0G81_3782 [Paraburkholderia sp. BL6665CI2N2]|nr:hypothetical protein B0G81_3782 [Paraburkholderia sp. BL6665CI2N2]
MSFNVFTSVCTAGFNVRIAQARSRFVDGAKGEHA